VVGSAQLVRPPRNNEAQAFSAQITHAFIAPYARGHGWPGCWCGAWRNGRRGWASA
jgi:hypothetical protein